LADFNQVDPSKYIASWNGIRIQGYMDGTMIALARDEDAYTGQAGSQGDVVVVRNLNRMGTVTVTLQQSSPTNTELSAKFNDSERTGTLEVGELHVKDLNGNTVAEAERAWLMKPADVELSGELAGREWAIQCAELLVTVGGNE